MGNEGKKNIRTYSESRWLGDEITYTRTVLEAFGLSVNNLKLSHNCKVAVRFKEHIRMNKSTWWLQADSWNFGLFADPIIRSISLCSQTSRCQIFILSVLLHYIVALHPGAFFYCNNKANCKNDLAESRCHEDSEAIRKKSLATDSFTERVNARNTSKLIVTYDQ